METAQTPTTPTVLNIDNDKCQKLKRFVIIGLLATIGILGWHFYEYFHGKPPVQAPNDVMELSKELYVEETKRSPYLFKVNVQGKTRAGAHDDRAPMPLFELHNDLLAMDADSTTALMRRLFDNYELDVAVPEQITAEEQKEEHEFLRAVMNTRIMKLTMRFLVAKKLVTADYDKQLELLKDIWFTPYSRGKGIVGSSAFEHVFMAELRNDRVLGLHNWIYFAEQEQQGHVDYKGWIDRVDLEKNSQFLLAIRATLYNVNKPYNVLMIGTSPELELSLYTVCFLTKLQKQQKTHTHTQAQGQGQGQSSQEQTPELCTVQLGHTQFNIITHVWDWHGKSLIATAYADISKE